MSIKNKVKRIIRLPSISGIARRKLTVRTIHEKLSRHNGEYSVLDIGSGIKNWYDAFNAPNLVNYDTVELKDELQATFHGDFFKINFERRYDFIIATEFIEHVPDPRAFFTRASSLLEKGGVLILSFPFFFKIHGDPDDFYRFTHSGLVSMSNGLFDVDVSYSHGGKFQVLWEVFVDGKLFYPLRVLNPLIASAKPVNTVFPLGYVVSLTRREHGDDGR